MNPFKSLSLAAAFTCLLASAASADVRGYCEAYARDAANGRVSGGEILNGKIAGTTPETSAAWIEVKGKALAGCLAQYDKTAGAPPETEAEAAAVPKAVKKARPAAKRGVLVPRSEAWNNYCDKKYASFDRKTGMYRSLKGRIRPCQAPRR